MKTATNPETGEKLQLDEGTGQWVPIQETQPAKPKGSLFDPLLEGSTFGYSGELANLGGRLGAWAAGAPSERIERAGQRQMEETGERLADVRERMFWPSMGLEVGGALMSGGPLLKGLTTGFRGVGLGNIAAPVGAATIEGAMAGAGAADENRILGGTAGATVGGLAAGGMPLVGTAARMAGEKTMPYLRKAFEGPTSTANRVLSETLQQAGETPTLLSARQRQLGPQATFADISGPSGIGLGQGVLQADKTGQAVTQARRQMAQRAAGSTQRLKDDIRGITGISGRLQSNLDAVRAKQKAAAGPAYDVANRQDISLTPKLKNLLARPPMQRAFNQAKEAAATRGEELPPFFQLDEFGDWQRSGVVPDMQAWDRMKQGIDRLIDSETDNITGRVTPKGRDLSMMKRELVSELDEINPVYQIARNAFAGDEAVQQSMRNGERFLNMKTREVTQAMDGATDSEKEAFLTGAVEAIREKMGRGSSGQLREFNFLEIGNTKEKLRDIFPKGRDGDRQLAELMRTLNRERKFAENRTALVGGSQTGPRLAAGEALKSGAALPTGIEALQSPIRSGIGAIMQAANNASSGLGPRAVSELGGMLFDPKQINRTMLEMQRRGVPPADMMQLMSRYATGGARMAPLLGLGAGEMTNQ